MVLYRAFQCCHIEAAVLIVPQRGFEMVEVHGELHLGTAIQEGAKFAALHQLELAGHPIMQTFVDCIGVAVDVLVL